MSLAELHEERHRIEKLLTENSAELAEIDATVESCTALLVEEGARRVANALANDLDEEGFEARFDPSVQSPRMKALVAEGLSAPVARVLDIIEGDPEHYFGKDLVGDDIWGLLARRGWRGATSQTVKQVFARRVAEASVQHVEKTMPRRPDAEKTRDAHWLWTDTMLMELGVQLWNETYKQGAADEKVRDHCAAVSTNWATGELTPGENNRGRSRQLLVEEVLFFAAKWAVHAFQRITTAHTYAAALMCSDADRDSLESIETQWHAFMVQVPSGMLTVQDTDGRVLDYNRVLVTQSEYGASIITLDQRNRHPARIVMERAANLADLLARGESETAHVLHGTASDPTLRALVLAKRLVAGLLLAMQHVDNFKAKTYPAKERKRDGRKREEPAHRVVFVGKPIQVDCRSAVSDYIVHGPSRKGSGPPSVQHVVRGHYKRQVVGVGRNGRKSIWIKPYWRGPDGAPIFTHPKKLGGASKEEGTE
jgi:hypothetical protein